MTSDWWNHGALSLKNGLTQSKFCYKCCKHILLLQLAGDGLSQDFSWDTQQRTKDRPPRRLHMGLLGPMILEPSWLRALLGILRTPEASSVASPASGDTGLREEAATLSAMLKRGRPHSPSITGTAALPPGVAQRFRLTPPALASPLQDAVPELHSPSGLLEAAASGRLPSPRDAGPWSAGTAGQRTHALHRGPTEGEVGRRCSPQPAPRGELF